MELQEGVFGLNPSFMHEYCNFYSDQKRPQKLAAGGV